MTETGEKTLNARSNRPPLPRPIQEYLGQKLRAQFHELGDKPRYLGDPMLPREFDPLIEKIEDGERMRREMRIGQIAHQAVAKALMDFMDGQAAAGRKKAGS
ncbi:hypothetical protein [Microvirga sp. 2TAF3]|uniref:hypothetical protein n=1 Tax=Microvirga sp. 2TAF3 TaxID=3233014 RepID=UPI003F9D2784